MKEDQSSVLRKWRIVHSMYLCVCVCVHETEREEERIFNFMIDILVVLQIIWKLT